MIEAAEQIADGLAAPDAAYRAWAATLRWVVPTVVGAIRGFVRRVLGRPAEPEPVEFPPAQPPSVGHLLVRIARREAWATVHACRAAAATDLNAVRGTKPAAEKRIQADLVRCLFGNPFRPTTFDPRWRTSTAVGLARASMTSALRPAADPGRRARRVGLRRRVDAQALPGGTPSTPAAAGWWIGCSAGRSGADEPWGLPPRAVPYPWG